MLLSNHLSILKLRIVGSFTSPYVSRFESCINNNKAVARVKIFARNTALHKASVVLNAEHSPLLVKLLLEVSWLNSFALQNNKSVFEKLKHCLIFCTTGHAHT
jgi:hypothetical protein